MLMLLRFDEVWGMMQTLTDKEYQRLRDAAVLIIREMGVECGGSNVQMAINPADGEVRGSTPGSCKKVDAVHTLSLTLVDITTRIPIISMLFVLPNLKLSLP